MIIKSALGAIIAMGLAAAVGSVTEAERTEHLGRMDEIENPRLDIEDAIAAKKGADIAVAADKIAALLEAERPYFVKGKAAPAIPLLDATIKAANDLGAAGKANDLAAAEAKYAALQASCAACHDMQLDTKVPLAK